MKYEKNLYALKYDAGYYPIELILVISADNDLDAKNLIPKELYVDNHSLYFIGSTDLDVGVYDTLELTKLKNLSN